MESATRCGMESRFSEHGINAEHCMESRTKTEKYKLSLDVIRGRAAIPYNSLCELMPYQSLRSWINKKTNRSSSFYFGGASRTRTLDRPVMLLFGASALCALGATHCVRLTTNRRGAIFAWLADKRACRLAYARLCSLRLKPVAPKRKPE